MVKLYGSDLFRRCIKCALVTNKNNPPGTHIRGGMKQSFDSGIDQDVFNSLNGKGICSGITTAWMTAFLAGNEDATRMDNFSIFFENVLRFHGAYIQFFSPNALSMVELLSKNKIKNTNVYNKYLEVIAKNIPNAVMYINNKLLTKKTVWCAYIHAYSHAIAVGSNGKSFFIMEPNGGLFEYADTGSIINDIAEFLQARAEEACITQIKNSTYEFCVKRDKILEIIHKLYNKKYEEDKFNARELARIAELKNLKCMINESVLDLTRNYKTDSCKFDGFNLRSIIYDDKMAKYEESLELLSKRSRDSFEKRAVFNEKILTLQTSEEYFRHIRELEIYTEYNFLQFRVSAVKKYLHNPVMYLFIYES